MALYDQFKELKAELQAEASKTSRASSLVEGVGIPKEAMAKINEYIRKIVISEEDGWSKADCLRRTEDVIKELFPDACKKDQVLIGTLKMMGEMKKDAVADGELDNEMKKNARESSFDDPLVSEDALQRFVDASNRVVHPAKAPPVQPESKPTVTRLGVKALAARKAPPAAPSPLNKEIADSITVLGEDFDSKVAKDILTKIKSSDLPDNAKRQFYSKLHQVAVSAGDASGLIGVLNAYIAPKNNTNLLVATTLQADPRKAYAPKANEEAAISAAKVDKPGVEPQPVRQSSGLDESATNKQPEAMTFKKK